MSEGCIDVIVVGGGIHGAGVAQAAAAAGYSVLLLEKSAIASATSSKSSKLIHGGLRYLESHQYGLVRECLKERSILLRNAPGLVRLVPFYIPVYQTTSRRPWKIHAGLLLYQLLEGFGPAGFKKLPSQQWPSLNGLKQEQLQAVFRYYDAQTDDAALTSAVIRSAQSMGAHIMVPASFIRAEIRQQHCVVHIERNGKTEIHQCGVLVNAAGPWANHILQHCEPPQEQLPVDFVQGAHLVVDRKVASGVFYLEAPSDRRAVFVMPWKEKTLVGTTETPLAEPSADVAPTRNEIAYLLDTFNFYFPQSRITQADVLDAFAGIRVLPRSADSLFHRSRDTQFLTNVQHKPRMISLFGGKLTAYRATAEKAVERIAASLPARKRIADTKQLSLEPSPSP